MGAANALELARVGRLGQPYGAPYDVVDQGPHHRLRRYATCSASNAPAALFVPPLMVTSEVYDLEAENSAVVALGAAGVQPYVVDFGAPEREQGGMKRTLDDHILAVVRSVEHVGRMSGRNVHLLGYSQGGMFAYQTAAYLRSEGLGSVITFGAPVDIHKNLPAVHKDAAALFIRFVEPLVTKSIERIEGLPGIITATGFKLLSTRKEIEQRLEFLGKLHDRGALVRREARRRFLGGEGFVAWPGPAFREFVEQFIVHNRMLSGGFVLSGRTVTLADIRCPVLAFIGANDDMARPPTIRAITRAAPDAPVSFVTLKAGHFGIVVGSRAMRETWPVVAAWVLHHEGLGPLPRVLTEKDRARAVDDEPEGAGFDVDVDWSMFVDTITDSIKAVVERVGDVAQSASDAIDGVRFQEPKLRQLANIAPDTRTSAGYSLRERALEQPTATFFLWQSRAFTYKDADTRVTNVVKGLWQSGVRPGDRVGVLMLSRPSFLSVVTALSRLGAVAVLAPPDAAPDALHNGFAHANISALTTDPQNANKSRSVFAGKLLVLGGGTSKRDVPAGAVDMEAIDPTHIEIPADVSLDAGRARDLAIVLLRPSDKSALRAAPVTNHRWALSALGASAACTLKPDDTVYSCVPLHHPAGILVSVGSALVSGSRLALGEGFESARFIAEVRRYGATVAFYAGEMLRPLLFTKPGRGDHTLPLRLFAGSGMRDDLWRKLKERFGVGVMEFYASTTERVIMANASGEKVGSLGRSLPGSCPVEVVKVDLASRLPLRDTEGRLVKTVAGEAGLMAARLEPDDRPTQPAAVIDNAFEDGDRWLLMADIVKKDEEGDIWFVDSRAGIVITPQGFCSTRTVESALFALPEVEMAAAWGEKVAGEWRIVAAVSSREPIDDDRVEGALATLLPRERPARVLQVDRIPLTEGFRPDRAALRAAVRQSLSQVSELSRE